MQADGTVFENSGAAVDDFWATRLVHRALLPAADFEQCLQKPDEVVRLDCIGKAAFGEELESCLPRCGSA
ncbi:hypothetical protein [Nannocystis bainbridge]|uniref:Uncharacterized protein n=1 Tax=Nannocystis bainbridge TaxID=2995303 RepID=A0ABT5EDA9_9BACT|nr:hypothetical protein [Nannocystis bainbridge]MDC0722898.1 hypothetical protein [Nannocystis bainbridge]